ncbi:hypothetical protein [Nocardioides sp. YIM 152588]|uniref:hypothetical protein n=1 Tax=Nocardioides sp. YIM 152588 TaxID=3158259 RepID=UPI0032E39094
MYQDLTRDQLARLLPELMLSGHMIDRAAMAYLLGEFGPEGQKDVAIEEWMGASPVYTRRLREALQVTGDTVEDICKVLQFDVGAPPQFLDFRYFLDDPYHGGFRNEFCGALVDAEPLGEEIVRLMCHDIQDPTFDATATATNPRARFRPVHRPPRVPADRTPHCHWLISIDPDNEPLPTPQEAVVVEGTECASLPLAPIDADDASGLNDYTGPLFTDIRFDQWSRSALLRLADEVALQHHLLALAFERSVERRADRDTAAEMSRKQFTGVAGLTAARLRDCLGLGDTAEDVATVVNLHPAFKPLEYCGVRAAVEGDEVVVRVPLDGPAARDLAWQSTLSTAHLEPFEALGVGVDAHWCEVSGTTEHTAEGDVLVVRMARSATPAERRDEVKLTYLSAGAGWVFEDRGVPGTVIPLNITPV